MDEQKRKQLSARLSDLLSESDKGYITVSYFLDPAELFFAEKYIKQMGAEKRTFFFGGYENAERKCAFFLPDYYEDLLPDLTDHVSVFAVIGEEIKEMLKVTGIIGSGYKKLTHRDFLGAVMNLGIDRSAVGDFCLTEENTCIIFSTAAVAELIKFGCERIGSDKVKIETLSLSQNFVYERKTKSVTDTVASDRLDCIVAALAGESREKAKIMILSGLTECNYSCCERTDLRVSNGDTITIRGIGKFIIDDITTETKKGRIRLSARKFI